MTDYGEMGRHTDQAAVSDKVVRPKEKIRQRKKASERLSETQHDLLLLCSVLLLSSVFFFYSSVVHDILVNVVILKRANGLDNGDRTTRPDMRQ